MEGSGRLQQNQEANISVQEGGEVGRIPMTYMLSSIPILDSCNIIYSLSGPDYERKCF